MVFDPDNPKHEAPCTCHGDQNGVHFCPLHRGKVDPMRVVNAIRSEAVGHVYPSAAYVCAAEARAKKAEAEVAQLKADNEAMLDFIHSLGYRMGKFTPPIEGPKP